MCAGLGGELRPANHIERRVMEAAKLGFSHIIVPEIHAPAATGRLANIDMIKCRTIKDALMVSRECALHQKRLYPVQMPLPTHACMHSGLWLGHYSPHWSCGASRVSKCARSIWFCFSDTSLPCPSSLRNLALPAEQATSAATCQCSDAEHHLRTSVLQAALGNVPIADPPPHQQIEEEFIG